MFQRSARRVRSTPVMGGWKTPLTEPIELASGAVLVTLEDAARFVADYEGGHRTGWNIAASGLLIAAEHTTPETVVEATNRLKSTLFFNRLLKREAS